MLAIAGASASSALRALASGPPSLVVFAFLNGLFLSVWAVCFPPAVAASTTERNRARGFSLVTCLGIGIGIGAGVLGGRLPALLAQLGARTGPVEAKRAALLLGSALVSLAILPALRLQFSGAHPSPSEKKSTLAAASLSDSYSRDLHLERCHRSLQSILQRLFRAAPAPFRRAHRNDFSFSNSPRLWQFWLRRGPAKSREYRRNLERTMATALMLAVLAFVTTPAAAAVSYIAYMAFQYMIEPCLFTLLMDRVAPAERSGASALNFLATSLAGILSAAAAGAAIPRFGYSFVLGKRLHYWLW